MKQQSKTAKGIILATAISAAIAAVITSIVESIETLPARPVGFD